MVKILFVLVIINYHGGVSTDLKFNTLQQCESAKNKIESSYPRLSNSPHMTCIEMQEKAKKLKCTIKNNFSYDNPNTSKMKGYPYPEGLICTEE